MEGKRSRIDLHLHLQSHLRWHKARIKFLELLIILLIRTRSVVFSKNAVSLNDKVTEAFVFENKLNELLLMTIDKEKYPNTAIFQNSMTKCRNYLLPCLYNLDIPPDNNGSERAIRNIKVKQKVSVQFITSPKAFCTIHSVIDTLLKKKL